MWSQTLQDMASILADVGPTLVAIVVPWLAFRYALLREQRQWSREQRAQVYVDLLVESSAELVGLRRHHVDLAGARVQVVEQAAEVAGKIIVNPPKTDAGRRVVTLPEVVVEALTAHLEEYAEPDPDGLVFITREAPTCCVVPSTGSCGVRRSSRSAWMACGCTTCGIRRRPWRRRPGRPPRS